MPDENNGMQNSGNEPSWWLDEKTPGVGDRPEWLGSKFKTAADLAKSYSELEKRVGVAPEKYDFSKSKYIDPEFQSFKELAEFAKGKRVPQEVMDKMLESVDMYLGEFTTDPSEELKKLGEDAPQRLQTLDNWVKANFTDEAYNALTTSIRTADGLKAMEEIRNKMMSNTTTVPNGNSTGTANTASMADLQEELNNNLTKYKTDPKYRADIQNRLANAAKQSSFVDKYK